MSFTDQQLSKWAQEYEREVCAKNDLIADRFSLEIKSGQYEYELPNYVTSIRAVFWLGKEIHPKGFRAGIMTGDVPLNPSGSIPYEYIISGKGLRVLQLKPTPMQDIPEYVGDLWSVAADRAGCIIEFYRTPSLTDSELQLPSWLRRYLLKDYVCNKAFASEGPDQDLRAAMYYQNKMGINEQYVGKIKENMNQAVINILAAEHKFNRRQRPHRPILPTSFGYPTTY